MREIGLSGLEGGATFNSSLLPLSSATQNEQAKRPGRVAGPMNFVAIPEVARQAAMFTSHCGKSVRREVHWKNG